MTSFQAQENTLKSEFSKMMNSLIQDNDVSTQKMKKLAENTNLDKEINEAEIERLDNIEERIQVMLEYLISKGT